MLTRARATLALPCLLAACQSPPAPPPLPPGSLTQAAAPATPAGTAAAADEWEWRVAPYVWAAGMNGDLTVKGNQLDFSMPFSDVLDDLNYSLQGVVQATHGEWTVLFDNTYLSLTSDATLSPGGGPGFEVDADAALWISELAGLRRLAPDSPYEVGLGMRYTEMRTDTHIATLPGIHDEDSVMDGIVVGRGTWPLDEHWRFELYADAGTGDSDFTWQSAATFGYAFERWNLAFGYRVLDYDVGGDLDADVQLKGLILGAGYRF